MVRTQVQFTEEQERRVRQAARREGISVAEFVRRCVERELASRTPSRADRYDRAAAMIGALRDQATDLSTNHDRYLEDAYE